MGLNEVLSHTTIWEQFIPCCAITHTHTPFERYFQLRYLDMLESRKLSIMKVLCSRWKQKMPKITFCWSLRLRRFLTNPKIYLWWPWFPRQLLLEFFLHFFFVWLISDPFEWSSYVSNNWPARKNYGKVQKWKNSFSFGYKRLQDVPTGHISLRFSLSLRDS